MEPFTRLYPDTASGLTADDIAALVPGEPPDDRPFLLVNMIATADGRATIAGRAGPIANRADYELFHALRTRVDAVMVGAETVRGEGSGRMVPDAGNREARVRAGLAADPLAVIRPRSVDVSAGSCRTPAATTLASSRSQHSTMALRGDPCRSAACWASASASMRAATSSRTS